MGSLGDIGPVLVTGAGGFVGGHVASRLQRDPACTVIAATRDGRNGSRQLDLRDVAGLRSGLAGVGAVVHCAVGDRAVTVDGTRALLAAAAAQGVRRFVHLSSVAVYGGATGAVTEDTPLVPATGQGYAAWKVAAEQACLAQTGMEVVRLRPAIVYGPGSQIWVAKLAERIRSGRWGTFGQAGEGICNLVHVADVATATEAALSTAGAGGGAFNVNGAECVTWNDWFSRMAQALSAPRLLPLAPVALRARVLAALPVKAASRLRPGLAAHWLLGAPARSELALFALRATYPAAAAQAALGWSPQIGIDQGLAGCVAWLRQQSRA